MNLLKLFEDRVRLQPEAIACVDDSRALDYAELSRRARAAAGALRAAGVAPGDTVGVLLTPSVDLVVAVWAVLHAGAAYLPLAVDYPAERLAYLVTDSAVGVVLTDTGTEELARRILPAGVRPLPISETGSGGAAALPGAPDTAPAYTIYTSGTTGSPKGVVISHRGIAHQMSWLGAELGLGAGARILLKTPVGFDAAQWELLANVCGATVVVAPAGTHISPERILDLVVREAVTVLQCVPTVWAELVALPGIGAATSLRTVVSGGEALPAALAERLRTALPEPRKINLYGPTETTINATWFDFTDADLAGAVTVPIGRAVDGTRAVVVDADDRVTEDGQIGELLLGGIQLADGYRNLPDITASRFVFVAPEAAPAERFYRTGDLVRRRADGTLDFVGRDDEQVKVNGHRIETNEVRVRLEAHHWVRSAAVVPWISERGVTQLAGFIELDPDEAPLMDQGVAGRHHRSKSTRTQIAAQLADLGVREFGDGAIPLPGAEIDAAQHRRVFARKTYRRFSGAPVQLTEIDALLRQLFDHRGAAGTDTPPTVRSLGRLLRWLGPFESPDRLLPKYFYASPGALNATQIYLETGDLPGLAAGVYYFHPRRHALYRVGSATRPGIRLHLAGLPRVIESVYSTNVREVLYFEAGHILGVLDEVAAEFGWQVRTSEIGTVPGLPEGEVTASVEIGPGPSGWTPRLSVLVQVHGAVGGARYGSYRYTGGATEFVTEQKIERRHVIAVNQRSYDESSFGVVLTTGRETGWAGFTELGRALAHLQQLGARAGFGFMSAGYASLSGRDLPSARRVDEIVGAGSLSYFALAGPVSAAQLAATDMAEDAVHMKGPEELLKDDLRAVLPRHMVPPTIHVLDRIPLSQNGKQDRAGLARLAAELNHRRARTSAAPAPGRETELARVWSRVLGYAPVFRDDDFFGQGGNSISALRLLREIEERLGIALPVQAIFRAPTLAALASATRDAAPAARASRFLPLAGDPARAGATTLLWPGLGGYPMSLRPLARELAQHGQVVYGVQARGLNEGERPHTELAALIEDDLAELLELELPGPLRIVGYSFGARVAAEVAQRLIDKGRAAPELLLIAPGSPVIADIPDDIDEPRYDNRYFKRVLASVFSGRTDPVYATELDAAVTNREQFVELIAVHEPDFPPAMVDRIVAVVEHTYRFRTQPSGVDQELLDRSLYLRARGDGPSFADIPVAPLRRRRRPVSNLPYHHYEIVTAGALDIAAAVLEQSMDRELV